MQLLKGRHTGDDHFSRSMCVFCVFKVLPWVNANEELYSELLVPQIRTLFAVPTSRSPPSSMENVLRTSDSFTLLSPSSSSHSASPSFRRSWSWSDSTTGESVSTATADAPAALPADIPQVIITPPAAGAPRFDGAAEKALGLVKQHPCFRGCGAIAEARLLAQLLQWCDRKAPTSAIADASDIGLEHELMAAVEAGWHLVRLFAKLLQQGGRESAQQIRSRLCVFGLVKVRPWATANAELYTDELHQLKKYFGNFSEAARDADPAELAAAELQESSALDQGQQLNQELDAEMDNFQHDTRAYLHEFEIRWSAKVSAWIDAHPHLFTADNVPTILSWLHSLHAE